MVDAVGNQFHWRDLADNNNMHFNYDTKSEHPRSSSETHLCTRRIYMHSINFCLMCLSLPYFAQFRILKQQITASVSNFIIDRTVIIDPGPYSLLTNHKKIFFVVDQLSSPMLHSISNLTTHIAHRNRRYMFRFKMIFWFHFHIGRYAHYRQSFASKIAMQKFKAVTPLEKSMKE